MERSNNNEKEFIGFSFASNKKRIKISEDSMKKAKKLLSEINELEFALLEACKSLLDCICF